MRKKKRKMYLQTLERLWTGNFMDKVSGFEYMRFPVEGNGRYSHVHTGQYRRAPIHPL